MGNLLRILIISRQSFRNHEMRDIILSVFDIFQRINEPLLRKDLEEAIKYAKSKGIINIYFVTNGSLLTEQRIEALLQSGVTKVFISIDAATEETYNKQRKNGLYKKVVRNVRRLVERRDELGLEFPKVRVSFLKNKTPSL